MDEIVNNFQKMHPVYFQMKYFKVSEVVWVNFCTIQYNGDHKWPGNKITHRIASHHKKPIDLYNAQNQ